MSDTEFVVTLVVVGTIIALWIIALAVVASWIGREFGRIAYPSPPPPSGHAAERLESERWQWGVRQAWPDVDPEVIWRGDRLAAEEWLAGYDPDNPPSEATLVRRLVVTGPVEEVPDCA